MKKEITQQIEQGNKTAFINQSIESSYTYRPQFISNNYKEGKKVLSSIYQEMNHCDSFYISVAFITESGITLLLPLLKELEAKHIQGLILTTDYLMFSQPKALKRLNAFKNIEIRMYHSKSEGFHTKGYIFKEDEVYKIIVGSSNLTQSALTYNKEWNTKIVSTSKGEYAHEILNEFNTYWQSPQTELFENFIEDYEAKYIQHQTLQASLSSIKALEKTYQPLIPNTMQRDFILRLKQMMESGEKRALLISATGTGKTYASAFAMKDLNQKRILFLVHREQIALQAMKSYQRIFGNTKTYGLLSGHSKELEKDMIFSTIQTMSKDEILHSFSSNAFQTIIIDEAHRIGASSYQKILDYFQPDLFLGMTASPERTDNFDVYEAFNHQIAYEIRLQQALEEDLLCPFHYFGISDLELAEDFNQIEFNKRINYIIDQIEYYGYCGERVKGLVFCPDRKKAIDYSEAFTQYGYRTISLTGEDSQQQREEAIKRLNSNNPNEQIDYIFTVDIFNEGIDIPEINQVIMLRPTQSPIIFVQQLGRGLRKSSDKDYVVILDFIGNYDNNFMIPIALSGDHTYNKDNLRRFVEEGEKVIPGASTIYFDAISKQRIYKAIDSANFSEISFLKKNYQNLKFKLGRIPTLQDFDQYGEMDVMRIVENKSLKSYYMFLHKYEKEYKIAFNKIEIMYTEFISKYFMSGKRIQELLLLKIMLTSNHHLFGLLEEELLEQYNIVLNDNMKKTIIHMLTNVFNTGSTKETYKECLFIEKDVNNDYKITSSFQSLLKNEEFKKHLEELVEFGMNRYERDYSERYLDTDFVLYQKYTYEDVCRLLNWEKSIVAQNIGGYKFDEKTKTFPIFINYDKEENIQDTIKYQDRFINNQDLISLSKQGRNMQSPDVLNFIHSEEQGIKVELFVRKNKSDKGSKEFYYLGRMHYDQTKQPITITMENTNKKAIELNWKLETPVREDLYEYIVRK